MSSRPWPETSLVGYVAAYGSTTPPNVSTSMIKDSLSAGYTVLVYAFGSINNTGPVTMSGNPNKKVKPLDLKEQIAFIHESNALALISFGGANNTFNPDPSNASEAASQIVDCCQRYGFDGVDLDLEDVSVSQTYIESLVDSIRAKDDRLYLTAAPQIAGGYGSPANLAPTGIFSESFLNNACFDALLVQNYNQFGGAEFNGLQDTQQGFITASFTSLTQFVPGATKIVVGEPANATAGSGLSNPAEIVADLHSGDVLSNPQYGGIMTWNINYDAQQEWSFARGVHSVT